MDETASSLLVTATVELPLTILRPFDEFDVLTAVDNQLGLTQAEIKNVKWEEVTDA
jgi:hypothetical protein